MLVDVAIIGAGPAGMAAALYCARAGKKVALLEQEFIPGGQMNNAVLIENYPGADKMSGADLAFKMFEQLNEYDNLDFFADEKVVHISQVHNNDTNEDFYSIQTTKKFYISKVVIEAIGMKYKKLENTDDFDFIHYCATCDGPLFTGQTVGVLGDGNTAISYALELSNYCQKVYLFTLTDNLYGEEVNIEILKNKPNIEQVVGKTHILGEHMIAVTNEPGTILHYYVEGLFVAIGMEYNEIKETSTDNLTKACGYFRAGDCNKEHIVKRHQVTLAVGDGTTAALDALDYLMEYENKN